MLNENGFCFNGDYQLGGSKSSSLHQACHDILCEADLKSYTVNLYNPNTRNKFTVNCPTNGGSVSMPAGSDFTGSIQCYPANVICTVPTDCPKWNPVNKRAWTRADGQEAGVTCAGHGTCQSDLSCACEFGYNGTFCEQRLCPTGDGGLECSGPGHGSCNRVLGQCQCGKYLADGTTQNIDALGNSVTGMYDGVSCDRLKCPDTGGLVCNGNGACNNDGECVCTGGYSGPSCELAPGCPQRTNRLFGCSNHGTCSENTGACSCAQMNRTYQVGTRCPGSGYLGKVALNAADQDGTDPENADASECRFWSGDDCSQGDATSPTVADQNIRVNETGAWVGSSFKNTSEYIFTTAEQTYTYFSFKVDDPNKDVAFIVDIQDGTDVSIFASLDNPVPSAVVQGTEHQWNFERPNDVNNTKELLQLCGSFSYKKTCQCDDSTGTPCPECSTSDDCSEGSVCVAQGRPGVSGFMDCEKQDQHARPGTLHVGVLARSHPTKTQSTYKVSLLFSKCTGIDGLDDGGGCYHGTCERSTGFCRCDLHSSFNDPDLDADMQAQVAWSGSDCSSPLCLAPKYGIGAGVECAGNGDCVLIGGRPQCICHSGWLENSTVCNEPAPGLTLPIEVPSAKIFSASGFSLATKGAPGAAASGAPSPLGLGKYQQFYFDIPLEYSVVSINVSAHIADHSREFHPNRGRPDFLVAASNGDARFQPLTFTNLDFGRFDYESWATRQMDSHLAMIRTKVNASTWYVTVLSTAYARADLEYSIQIQGTSPSQDSGSCSRLSWAYKTCGGGNGVCNVPKDDISDLCDCAMDTNKAEFFYHGQTCRTKIWYIPKQYATITDDEKILPSPANLTFGDDFGETDADPLEPGEWTYFELDTRNIYGSLTVSMTVLNSKDEISSGVVAPLLLVRKNDGNAKLPALDPDEDTLYDISGAYSGVQTITLEGGTTGKNAKNGQNGEFTGIENYYYVAVYNQLHSRSALKFSLRVVSTPLASTTLPTCANSPCIKGHTKSPGCVDDLVTGRECTCSGAWTGPTCSFPTLRSTTSLLKATTNIVTLGNNDNLTVPINWNQFRFFKIPQPLKVGQGVQIRVCDTSVGTSERSVGSGPTKNDRRRLSGACPASGRINGCCCGDLCADPDIYLATQLPRSAYDFGQIRANPNGSTEVLTVFNTSASGRYYLAVYAGASANFLVETKLTAPPIPGPRATDKYFFQLLAIWLTTETAGVVVLIVMCTLTGILCAGCFCTACCSHENLHNSEGGKASWAGTFGRIIGSSSQYVGKPPPPPGPDPKARASAHARAGQQMEVEMSAHGREQQVSVEVTNPYGRGRRSMI